MMLLKGKTVAAGGASLGFDFPVNALAYSATGNLTVCAPLGEKTGQTSVSAAGGVRVQTVNGQASPGANAAKMPLPTWKEKQDKMS